MRGDNYKGTFIVYYIRCQNKYSLVVDNPNLLLIPKVWKMCANYIPTCYVVSLAYFIKMEDLSKLLVVIGLLLDIVGVVMLAWDIVISPSKYWWPERRGRAIEFDEIQTNEIVESIKNRPQPPYTQEMIEVEIMQQRQKHAQLKGRLQKEIEAEINKINTKWDSMRFQQTRNGLFLIILGFTLQAVGTMLG